MSLKWTRGYCQVALSLARRSSRPSSQLHVSSSSFCLSGDSCLPVKMPPLPSTATRSLYLSLIAQAPQNARGRGTAGNPGPTATMPAYPAFLAAFRKPIAWNVHLGNRGDREGAETSFGERAEARIGRLGRLVMRNALSSFADGNGWS